jgi:hypothetical protein
MKLADWIRMIASYGPNAILVLLVFITEKKIRTAIKEDPGPEKKKLVYVYIFNWFLIFGVAIFAIYAWKKLYIDAKPEIRGTLFNLSSLETLSSTSADLYQNKREKGNSHSAYDSYWRLIPEALPWDEGAKIRFVIQGPKPNSKDDDLYEYELPIERGFYETPVSLIRRQGDLFLDRNGRETKLQGGVLPGNGLPISKQTGRSTELFPVAYAQTAQQPFSSYDFTVGLESPDAIVRRKTRYDLSLQEQTVAVPWIDSVLRDPKSSYRLRIGVLVALNNMPHLRAESLTPAIIAAIQNTLNDPDDALRNEALGLARKYKLIPVIVYEHIDFSGKSQAYGPGIYRADKSQLGSLPNDSASSLSVAKGFGVRLCDDEANGKGDGLCEVKGSGRSYKLQWGPKSVADKVSFIQVFTLKKVTID